MFGNNKKESPKGPGNGSSTPHSLNSLTQGAAVEGFIKADSDLRVDGKIKGTLHCAAKLIIGPSGHVEGEIRCKNAVIEGKFSGHLEVEELLNVRETAKIEGDIIVQKLVVQTGAVFNVTCIMGGVKKSDTSPSHTGKAHEPSAKSVQPAEV